MKKYLPFAVVGVALLVVVGIVMAVRGGGSNVVDEEENVAELPVEQRPVTMLVPRADGHWMDLTVENINVLGASTIEYEFTYTTADGRSQGTGGMQPFSAGDNFESEVLIGTTSSGKFYYDEGVESGDLTLKFRNDDGKLVGRLKTPWRFASEPESVDFEGFTFTPEDSEDIYIVAMNTFGLPNTPGSVVAGPVGFFASGQVMGGVSAPQGNVFRLDGTQWHTVEAGSSVEPSIFISVE